MGAGDRHLMKRKLQLQGMSASDGMLLKKTRRSEEEGYGILKASKEAVAAVRLMRFHHIPGGLDIWMDHWLEMKAKMAAEEEEAIKNKKRKRVVKRRVPKALIDHMVAWPFGSANILTPVQLAKRSLERRRYYALSSFIEAKLRAYQQALIRQYQPSSIPPSLGGIPDLYLFDLANNLLTGDLPVFNGTDPGLDN